MSKLAQRVASAESVRAQWTDLLDECYRLALPNRSVGEEYSPGLDRSTEIYDETAVVALAEFGNRMMGGLFPNGVKFARLKPSTKVAADERQDLQADLDMVEDLVFAEVFDSNFVGEAHEAIIDMGISQGVMLVEDGGPIQTLVHTALALNEVCTEIGPQGEISAVYRRRWLRNEHLQGLYPDAEWTDEDLRAFESAPEEKVKVTDCFWRDFSVQNALAYKRGVLMGDRQIVPDTEIGRGQGACPWVVFRMGKAAGETMGRGPLMNVMAAVRTTNYTVELLLQSAAMNLIGMYQVDADAEIAPETINFEPGIIIPKMPGSEGLTRVDIDGRNVQLGQIILEEQRMNIKKAMFNDMLSDPNKTPATAYEVSERMGDLANRMSAAHGRFHYEIINQYMRRVIWILHKRGLITDMPAKWAEMIDITSASPLAVAQGMRDVQGLMQYHQISATIFGPQLAATQYDLENLAEYLRDRLGQSENLFRNIAEVQEGVAEMASAVVNGPEEQAAGPQPVAA